MYLSIVALSYFSGLFAIVLPKQTVSAALLPTRSGYNINNGPILRAGDPQSDIALSMVLDSSSFYSGDFVRATMRVRNICSERPLPYDAAGGLRTMQLFLHYKKKDSTDWTTITLAEPQYKPHVSSANLTLRRLMQGEQLNLPVCVNFALDEGDYLIKPVMRVKAAPKPPAVSMLNENDWSGEIEGLPIDIRVQPKPSIVKQGLAARFLNTIVKQIPIPNSELESKGGKGRVKCKLIKLDTSSLRIGQWYRAEIEILNPSESIGYVYSPVNWHRTLASVDAQLIWEPANSREIVASPPIEDPMELCPTSQSQPPVDELRGPGCIKLQFEFMPIPKAGDYVVYVAVESPWNAPDSKGSLGWIRSPAVRVTVKN